MTTDKPAPSDKPQDKDNAGSLMESQLKAKNNSRGKRTREVSNWNNIYINRQVVHDITKEPVETNTGASIVSTQGGNVVLSDGSVVAPEEVGGTVNEDKTISVTDKDGKLKPFQTQERQKALWVLLGLCYLQQCLFLQEEAILIKKRRHI